MDKVSDFVNVNGTRLYYEIEGLGQALVLIHSFSTDCRQWRDQVAFFASHYKVICYDMRGFGKSDVPSGENYTHAEDLKALLDHLGIEKAHILGHSLGGVVSTAFAILYPDQTLSMIGADPALEGFESDDPDTQKLFTSINKIWTAGSVDAAKELWLQFSPWELAFNNPEVAPHLKQMIEDYSGWHWVNENPHQPLDPLAIEQLEKIKSPTLLLIGNLNMSFYHLVVEVMLEKIPNSQRVYVSGTAHMLNMEDPDQFNAKLLKFLQSIENS